MSKFLDYSGRRFGTLIARYPEQKIDSKGIRRTFWRCFCLDCEKDVYIRQNSLRQGAQWSRFCGCKHKYK